MLTCEISDLQRDLSNARRNIRTLVKMHTEASKGRDDLTLEVSRLRWTLGDALRANGRQT